jgi:hypothetical protein
VSPGSSRKGLVRGTGADADGRGVVVALTDVGLARLAETAPVHARGISKLFVTRLDDQELAILERALGKLILDCSFGWASIVALLASRRLQVRTPLSWWRRMGIEPTPTAVSRRSGFEAWCVLPRVPREIERRKRKLDGIQLGGGAAPPRQGACAERPIRTSSGPKLAPYPASRVERRPSRG